MKIEVKLLLIGIISTLIVAFFSIDSILQNRSLYKRLNNFQKVSELVISASDILYTVTEEKHLTWFAINLPGDNPETHKNSYRNSVSLSRDAEKTMIDRAANIDLTSYSDGFSEKIEDSFNYIDELEEVRHGIINGTYTDFRKAKATYVPIINNISSIYGALLTEIKDPELIKKILAQDYLNRMKFDLWYLRGLTSSILRKKEFTPHSRGKAFKSLENITAAIDRVRNISNKQINKELDLFLESDSFKKTFGIMDFLVKSGEKVPQEIVDKQSELYNASYAVTYKELPKDYHPLSNAMAVDMNSFVIKRLDEVRAKLNKSYIISISSIILLIISIYFINRSITLSIQHSTNILSETAKQGVLSAESISESSKSLADDASAQAHSLQEITTQIGEMSTMMQKNLETVREAETLATDAKNSADTGAESISEMKSAMEDIQTSSDEVSKIIKTIEEIAFQTNILALNAAVEAARAGEAGAGFAVVADEVRSLAQRSSNAVKETSDQIQTSLSNSQHGYQISLKAAKALDGIVKMTYQFNDKLNDISKISQENNEGTEKIAESITQLDDVVRSNAASAEEVASISVMMTDNSNEVKTQIRKLESL